MGVNTIQIADKTTLDKINDIITNTTYGLNALQSLINGKASSGAVSNITTLLNNSNYGLSAIKSAVNSIASSSSGGGATLLQQYIVILQIRILGQ